MRPTLAGNAQIKISPQSPLCAKIALPMPPAPRAPPSQPAAKPLQNLRVSACMGFSRRRRHWRLSRLLTQLAQGARRSGKMHSFHFRASFPFPRACWGLRCRLPCSALSARSFSVSATNCQHAQRLSRAVLRCASSQCAAGKNAKSGYPLHSPKPYP